MCWKPSKKRGFEVRGYYRVLIRTSDQLFPWKSKWKSKIHSRVSFFVWTAALGKILTIGDWYSDHLEFFGQCQGWLLTYKPVGKVGLVSIEMVSFGWLLPIVWCGTFEGRENDQRFEDSEWSLSNLKLFFFKTLLDWMSVVGSIFTCSVCDLIYHCNFRAWLYCPQLYTSCIPVYLCDSNFLQVSIKFIIYPKNNTRINLFASDTGQNGKNMYNYFLRNFNWKIYWWGEV